MLLLDLFCRVMLHVFSQLTQKMGYYFDLKRKTAMAMSSIFVKSFQITALASALALAGCGGKNDTLPNTSVTPKNTGNTGNTGTTPQTVVKIDTIKLTDATGSFTSLITSSNNVTASVKVTDGAGSPISGALVRFSAEGVKFGTTNGAVLTNAEGVAKISVIPVDLNATGAYTMSASVSHNNETSESGNINFTLQPAELKIEKFIIDKKDLESGGSTNVTLVTTDGTSVQNNIGVDFSASCGSFTPSSATSSNQGNVTTTYRAIDANGNLCEGEQNITARLTTGGKLVQDKLSIASIKPSAIMYTTTQAINLVSKTSGSATTGTIEFTVYFNGTPVRNQEVIVSKTAETPLDFSFGSAGNTTDIKLRSNSEGKIVVDLYPGALPGPVELRATLASDKAISVVSKNVAVVQSRAVQNGITATVTKTVLLNNRDDESSITMRFTNRNGTSIPTGTTVNFVSEGGMITPSCSTDEEGKCTVKLTSQNPRPANGRVSVLAYLEGEKQYIDVDGDNIYTSGKDRLTSNIGDLFRDDNENNQYDAEKGEFIYRRNVGTLDCKADAPVAGLPTNLKDFINFFNTPNIPKTCNNELSATLRKQMIFGFADEIPTFVDLNPIRNGEHTFYMYGHSDHTVSMPSGTTIEVTAEDKTADNKKECTAEIREGEKIVPDIVPLSIVNEKGNYFKNTDVVKYKMVINDCDTKDKINVVVKAPNGRETKLINEWK